MSFLIKIYINISELYIYIMEKNIILISVGVFQEYIKDNIEQLVKLKFIIC